MFSKRTVRKAKSIYHPIRATERETGTHVVVVALTANVLEDDREACIEAGMDDFLPKPLQLDALRVALDRWLSQRV